VRAAGDIALADHMDARGVRRATWRPARAASKDARRTSKRGPRRSALASDDREVAAHWVLTVDGTPRDAIAGRARSRSSAPRSRWIAADSLNEMFIHDDEEKRLGDCDGGRPGALARATQILDEAVGRGWSRCSSTYARCQRCAPRRPGLPP
jgi:hypothetical protein